MADVLYGVNQEASAPHFETRGVVIIGKGEELYRCFLDVKVISDLISYLWKGIRKLIMKVAKEGHNRVFLK